MARTKKTARKTNESFSSKKTSRKSKTKASKKVSKPRSAKKTTAKNYKSINSFRKIPEIKRLLVTSNFSYSGLYPNFPLSEQQFGCICACIFWNTTFYVTNIKQDVRPGDLATIIFLLCSLYQEQKFSYIEIFHYLSNAKLPYSCENTFGKFPSREDCFMLMSRILIDMKKVDLDLSNYGKQDVSGGEKQDMTKVEALAILGLKSDASEQDIKSTYRKLSIAYHPDKNKSPTASDKFIKIQKAYKFLTD